MLVRWIKYKYDAFDILIGSKALQVDKTHCPCTAGRPRLNQPTQLKRVSAKWERMNRLQFKPIVKYFIF